MARVPCPAWNRAKIAPVRVGANSGRKMPLNPLKPGGEEAVEAGHAGVRIAPMARQGAQIAVRSEELGDPGDFLLLDWLAAGAGFTCEQRRDLLLTFLGFERADAVYDLAAGLRQGGRAVEQPLLQADELRKVTLALEPADVGMAADRAGRGTRRVDQYGIERAALPFGRVGGDHVGMQAEPHQILAHTHEPIGRALDRGNAR